MNRLKTLWSLIKWLFTFRLRVLKVASEDEAYGNLSSGAWDVVIVEAPSGHLLYCVTETLAQIILPEDGVSLRKQEGRWVFHTSADIWGVLEGLGSRFHIQYVDSQMS